MDNWYCLMCWKWNLYKPVVPDAAVLSKTVITEVATGLFRVILSKNPGPPLQIVVVWVVIFRYVDGVAYINTFLWRSLI